MGFTGGQDKSCIGMHCLVGVEIVIGGTAYIHGRLYIYTLHCPLRDGPRHTRRVGAPRQRRQPVMETYLRKALKSSWCSDLYAYYLHVKNYTVITQFAMYSVWCSLSMLLHSHPI